MTMAACYSWHAAWQSLPAAEAGGHSQHSASHTRRAAARRPRAIRRRPCVGGRSWCSGADTRFGSQGPDTLAGPALNPSDSEQFLRAHVG